MAVTITAVTPTGAGALIAYQAQTPRPAVTDVRYPVGRNTSAAAVVRTSTAGRISVFNAAGSGSTDVVVDVAGYYVGGIPSDVEPGVLHTVTPLRRYDSGPGKVGAGKQVTVAVGGRAGIPARVGTIAAMISVVVPARSGALTAHAAGSTRPAESTMPFLAGVNSTAFAFVPADSSGRIALDNISSGAVRITVDVVGYTVAGVVSAAGALQPRAPARILAAAALAAHTSRSVEIAGHGGVPPGNLSAVVVTITVASAARAGGVVAWRAGTSAPGVTNVQFAPRQTVSDLAVVAISAGGAIGIRNSSGGPVRIYLDVAGYLPATPIAPPTTSTGRYVRNITATGGGDVTTMTGEGCQDAIQSRLVLLELGAQTVTAPLSLDDPGVLLTGQSAPQYRLSYDRLNTVLHGYLSGFYGCVNGASATVALGTNNDGDYAGPYPPTQRGADWASRVVAPLRAAADADYPGVTVVGADDIEAGFASTEQQAEDWETGYLGVDDTAGAVGPLIYNGSADGCPTAVASTGQTCANGWTQADYYRLSHGIDPNRLRALPQIYTTDLATQWANIEATGGNDLLFAGVLTEFAACPVESDACPTASLRPTAAWTALSRARSALAAWLEVPAATDLQVS